MSEALSKPHLLVVDDDSRLRALLKRFLSEQGMMVSAAADAPEAREMMKWFAFDLLVLDVMMPGESGLELLASVLKKQPVPVLMLSAMGEAQDRIKGLEIGAQDYLAKPFDPKELVLRIKTILTRAPAAAAPVRTVAFGPFVFDVQSALLTRAGEPILLTTSESALLLLLARQAGKPVSRESLARNMPGAISERSVDVQVTRLRKKIEESEGKPLFIQTVRGAGYMLQAGGA